MPGQPGASTANYNPIQVYTCNSTGAQQWTEVSSSNTLRVLGKCLDVNGSNTGNGTPVDLFDRNGTGAQVWIPWGNGAFCNPQSNKCLDQVPRRHRLVHQLRHPGPDLGLLRQRQPVVGIRLPGTKLTLTFPPCLDRLF
ncbi:ricin-type beta-trefoil lectin domain protein [Streptomyces sp. NPDC048527]|uniref:ricin-type beta-trefoil lectin domain protein n=1 Tax=Streptomyces sp. NPDC048527 TaxID=3365568 RepID=UPI003721F8CB